MKNKVITVIFLIIIFGFSILSIIKKDIDISAFERRRLTQLPNKIDSDFTNKLDDYFVDQFIYRNELISLNSKVNRDIFRKIDDKDVYIIDDNIFEINYPLNEKNCVNFYSKMNYITNKYFSSSNIYYSIIPDKCYFLDNNKYLKIDYDKMYSLIKTGMSGEYIDITSKLEIDDYYLTDIHWKQENILDISEVLIKSMGNEYINQEYKEIEYNNFYGASYSKGNNKIKPDTLRYLSDSELEKTYVNHLEYGQKPIYDAEKLYGIDSYDIFLSGPSSYIEITNEKAETDKTLIVFRDSFASSIIPFFVPYYSKIVAVDLRYIDLSFLGQELVHDNCDVLYLYSTLIINNSSILKVAN